MTTTTTTTTQPSLAGENKKENKIKELFYFQLNWMQENAVEKFCDEYAKLFGESSRQYYLGNPNVRSNAEELMMCIRHMTANHSNSKRIKYVAVLKAMETNDYPAYTHMSEVIALYDKMYANRKECFSDPEWKAAYIKQLKL